MLEDIAYELIDLAISRIAKLVDRPTTGDIRERVLRLNAAAYNLSAEQLEDIIVEIETRVFTSMAKGDAVVGKGLRLHWLASSRTEIDFAFWARYAKYLQYDRSFPPSVIKTLDSTLDDLLELLGNPRDDVPFLRRGLVVGDVQSGKTATYIGLCCKAADAGYKIIILLAGHLNTLRYQTQERLDEGFAGRDSKLVGKPGGEASSFGVAKYDRDLFVHEYTTKLHDFDTQAAQSAGSPLAGLRGPALLVVKKNKTILQNMFLWLKSLNAVQMGKIHSSLLLIDDEADFASVNTGTEYDPKAINQGIRQLLDLFDKASYVGVTATPFANVFIAPESKHHLYGDDLFPEDYIYSLEPPSNYVGANQVFYDELDATVREFNDVEPIIPLRHTKALIVAELPLSLMDALYAFILSNTIRDKRLEGASHRSMLVNVSPTNAVQAQVSELLRESLIVALKELHVFGGLSVEEARQQSEVIARIEVIFEREYAFERADGAQQWVDLLPNLYSSNKDVRVQTINMSSKARLNYDQHPEGLRVVAIGGHSLSRGLTLEGLCISYFHRNSKAYDTLLQMGRWFGYRPHYRDLCRVYMTEEAVANYRFITDAVSDLRSQFQHMREIEATPLEFGLKVRASPAGLMMTAASKMKTAKKVMFGAVSYSSTRFEATQLDASESSLASNEAAVGDLLQSLTTVRSTNSFKQVSHFWGSQPKSTIIRLLDQYRVHPVMFTFRPNEIAEYLRKSSLEKLAAWDICVRKGSDEDYRRYGLTVRASLRTLKRSNEVRSLFTLGEQKSRRLGSSDDDLIGLGAAELSRLNQQILEARNDDKKTPVGYLARLVRDRPLLTVYVIKAVATDADSYIPSTNPFAAISLTFPEFVDDDIPEREIVLTNPIWQRYQEGLRADIDDDDREMNEE